MRRATSVVLLACAARAHDASQDRFVDELLDSILERPSEPSLLGVSVPPVELESTALGKAGQLRSPTQGKASAGAQVLRDTVRRPNLIPNAHHPSTQTGATRASATAWANPLGRGQDAALTAAMKDFSRSAMATKATVSAGSATLSEPKAGPKVVSHPAFDIVSDEKIEEYGVQAIMYRHKKSGAQVMSVIAPEDENKVFGITFRTPPDNSMGIPHILEHSVLCGSEKYPVKEPFVDLLKGSLQNFLNAMTFPDRTCYPVASTNTKDFYNLASVYLDAVLRPRAIKDPQVLQQEGWHYELENPDDPLTYKGVVYNEMKGVYSSPDSLLMRGTQQALFPDNTYGVDSGGDPLVIPDLSFNEFKGFHSRYYSPSNSYIFFYGDDDPYKRLTFLDGELKDFDKIDVDSTVTFQPKDKKPERKVIPYPIAKDAEPKHALTVNWLLNDEHLDQKDLLALEVLNYLLLGTSTAVLMKTLIESQLGEQVTGGGFSGDMLQATFGVGLKGVKESNVQAVEELVISTLKKISEDGFEKDAIAAAVNTFEFQLREFNTGGFPKGLAMMLGMISSWIYDRDPVNSVRFEADLAAVKKDLAEGKPLFQDLMKKYIVNNDHRVTVELKPDTELEASMIKDEESRLEAIKGTLTQEQIANIITETKLLKEAQAREDSPEAKATLPRLTKEDIEPKARELPIEVVKDGSDGGETILTHNLQTSGILYADIGFDYSNLDQADLELLPLFSRMVMETGTSDMDETTLQRKIGTETGGIGTSLYSSLKHTAGVVSGGAVEDALLYFMIRGKAVTDKVPAMFDLMKGVLNDANLNNQKRAVEMLRESKISKETSVISSGHTYAASRLAAKYSFLGYLGEVTGGITSLRRAGGLLEEAENDWPSVYKRLASMRDKIVKKNGMIVNLVGDDKVLAAVKPAVESFVASVKTEATVTKTLAETFSKDSLIPFVDEGFSVPSQVNYVVKGGQIYEPGEKVSGASSVVSRFLSLHYLWDNVRVMGGAYGGFARFSDASGRMSYLSYRDPNLQKTLDIYDKAPDSLLDHPVNEDDILQGVIGAIGDLDGPMSPDQKGYVSMGEYLNGESQEDRQKWRDQVLNCSPEDFKSFGERMKRVSTGGSVCVVGSESALEEANKARAEDDTLKIESAF